MNRNNTLVLALLGLAACTGGGDPATTVDPGTQPPTGSEDSAMVQGRVTDANGSQGRFAGSGSLSSTTKVEAHLVGPGGELTFVSEAELDAQGAYDLEIPDDADIVLVQAVDASGDVVGSVVVEPSDDDVRIASPMTRETSVEAETFLMADADVDVWADVRAYIDTRVATAVATSSDAEADLIALSDAVRASAAARANAYADQGLSVTAIQEAWLDASIQLSEDLDAEVSNAYEVYLQALDDAEADAGASAEESAEIEADAAFAFRVVLDSEGATDLLDASAGATARAEAYAWNQASIALLTAAGATQAVLDEAASANAELQADLSAAASADAAADAVADWRTELVGSASVEGSILGSAIGADLIVEAALDTAIATAVAASTAIQADVSAAVAARTTNNRVDAEAFAEDVLDIMAQFRSDLWTSVGDALPDSQPEATIELIVSSQTSFQGL